MKNSVSKARMERKSKMVIYFSGTGNSRYAAEVIASELGDEI